MTTSADPTPSPQYGLQEYLSLGYLYLMALGLVGDVVYYQFFGIDILAYASTSDVLMAPIDTLLHDWRVFFLSIATVGIVYLFYINLLPWYHAKNRNKDWYRKMTNIEKADKTLADIRQLRWRVVLIFFPMFLIGLKIGFGIGFQKKVKNGDIKADHQLTLPDNTTQKITMVGQNTGYLFFVPEGQRNVVIMPIGGNVKAIEKIKK